ncbi:MAG: molybdenum cofactor guanylyltransferase [Planctomycetes bacterium]|nr:molybdenum cofactor guanylyltransferase [Planctomycetota bacterium]
MAPRMAWDAAVVLAGGRSARMGREKALLEDAAGRPLVARLLEALAPRFERLLLSVGAAGLSPELAAAVRSFEDLAGRRVEVVPDRIEGCGPLAAVEACLGALGPLGAQRAFFAAVDVPEVDPRLVGALWDEASRGGSRGCVPRWSRGLEPACAVYGTGILDDVRRLLEEGRSGFRSLAALPGVRVLDLGDPAVRARVFGPEPPSLEDLFRNLNAPSDYEAWRKAAVLDPPGPPSLRG